MSPSSEVVARQRHKRYWYYTAAAPYVTAGLTAYWNSTQQQGTESNIVEIVGGPNATHTGSPTFDSATRLWLYNGSTQASRSSIVSGLNSPSYIFTLETVLMMVSSTPNFGDPAGLGTTGGGSRFTFEGSGANVLTDLTGQASSISLSGSFGTLLHAVMT